MSTGRRSARTKKKDHHHSHNDALRVINSGIKKKKKRVRHRWAPKSEWKTYIVRVASAEGFRIHGDSTEIVNYLINWWIDAIATRSLHLMQNNKRRQTYNRKTIRAATTSLCKKKPKMAKFALNFEAGCFRRYDQRDYVVVDSE